MPKRSGSSARGARAAVSVRRTRRQIDFSDIPDSSTEQLRTMRRVGRPPLGDEPRPVDRDSPRSGSARTVPQGSTSPPRRVSNPHQRSPGSPRPQGCRVGVTRRRRGVGGQRSGRDRHIFSGLSSSTPHENVFCDTDIIGPKAPVRGTGPRRTSMPCARAWPVTASRVALVTGQRSDDPGTGTAALGSSSAPAC
jgi:hypothetical protein